MRILITGPTSFSGAYFIEALRRAGHHVITTFTQSSIEDYQGTRLVRAQKAVKNADAHFGVSFGSDEFLDLVKNESIDIFCHHGAWTTNYNSMDYDFQAAYQNNTRSMMEVCEALSQSGCRGIILSASIFEGGIQGSKAFSPHGLVKQLTSETTSFYGKHVGMHVSRFVIPNPFGALDNPKLIDYLCREWLAGRAPTIRTPLYVRDNIHVELMAKGFVYWVENMPTEAGDSTFSPAGYISSMGDFVGMVATEMRKRLGLECAYELGTQTDFSQPMVLVNDAPLNALFTDWDATSAWDSLAEHQKNLHSLRSE
jgi:UDP-glucose 4-epimerase